MAGEFIALDWGTTSFRAYRATPAGDVLETIAAQQGILAVSDSKFEAALEQHIGAWDTSLPILAAGMITSRQGWIEVPYVPCPAGVADLANALHHCRTRHGRSIFFSTGLSYRAPDGIPDVMRGEETKVFGNLEGPSGYFVSPGTHSKWIAVEDGRITRFTTYVTGEVFAALKDHTILGRLMKEDATDEAAFDRAVTSALADPGGFLHRIFATRTLGLFEELSAESLSSFLSGQVIGTEIAHAMQHHPREATYFVLGSEAITGLYVRAMQVAGLDGRAGDPTAVVKGLARIAAQAGLII
jgi:2-dehydro-3-deoxygalactonokinase